MTISKVDTAEFISIDDLNKLVIKMDNISFDTREEFYKMSEFDSYDELEILYKKIIKFIGKDIKIVFFDKNGRENFEAIEEFVFLKSVDKLIGKYLDKDGFLYPYCLIYTFLI